MNEELRERLVQDLRTSGFYAEMLAVRECRTAGWDCRGSFTYFDKDERTTRECDFEAVREWPGVRDDGTPIKVGARLLGQVKKSEKPWIVFIDRGPRHFDSSPENLLHAPDKRTRWNVGAVLREYSAVHESGWIASGIHEAFKKPSDASKWYSAFVSVSKACESAYEATAESGADLIAQLTKPIVVLDGLLMTAELDDAAKLILTETNAAAFRFEYRSDRYDRPAYDLDLVTLTGFPRYLQRMAQRMEALLRGLQSGGVMR